MPVEGVNKDALRQQVANYAPVGWTPIGLSLERAGADFPAASDTVTNAIILVTDGLETCDADPCAIATALKQSEAGDHGVRRRSRAGRGRAADHELHRREHRRPDRRCAERRRALGGAVHLPRGARGRRHDRVPRDRVDRRALSAGDPDLRRAGGDGPQPAGRRAVHLHLHSDTNRVEAPVGVCDLAWTNPSGNETAIRVNIEADRTTFVRGSLLKFPQGAGEIYVLKAQDGTVIWQDQIEQGDWVWVLPGIYTCDLPELVGDPILMSFTVQTLPGSATQVEIFTAP